MIPPKKKYTGDDEAGKDLVGMGLRRMAKLRGDMKFQGLETHMDNPLVLQGGASISCTSIKGVDEVHIHVPQKGKPRKGVEHEVVLDNRFFVRVGKPSDIVYDESGNVVTDNTRYYWIDFFARPNASELSRQIAFYRPGSKKEYDVAQGGTKVIKTRNVSRATFLQAVTFLPYMYHNYVRSFDLPKDVNAQAGKASRFVAGYHFLATGKGIIFTPSIPMPAGGDYDDVIEVSKNPPNRFFVDIESRTLCWYHVLQEWKETVPLIHNESTGSISGAVVGVDWENKTWSSTLLTLVSVSGDIADSFSITGIGSNALLEPIGIVSDIISLSRSNAEFCLAYLSQPIQVNCFWGSGFSVDSCSAVSSMTSALAVSSGYEWYQSATFSMAEGEDPDILQADTTVVNSFSVHDCEAGYPASCPTEIEIIEDGWSYFETKASWSETIARVQPFGVDGFGYTELIRGRENGAYGEGVYSILHYCEPILGGCIAGGNSTAANRLVQGYATGSFGRTPDLQIPCQNITMHLSTSSKVVNTTVYRSVQGPDGGALTGNISEDLGHWNTPSPLLTDDPPFDICTETYPAGYTMEDPANWLTLENFPIPLDDLVFGSSAGIGSYTSNQVYNYDQTVDTDVCYIKDCPRTFTASKVYSAIVLDDRWSAGSQGQVVAVKSELADESSAYHNGVDKLQAIIAALTRDRLIKVGESLIDIGLI